MLQGEESHILLCYKDLLGQNAARCFRPLHLPPFHMICRTPARPWLQLFAGARVSRGKATRDIDTDAR